MAKDDKKNETPKTSTAIDISQYLPEGYSKDDLVIVGGLRPVIGAELQFDQKSIVAGHIVSLLSMPPRPKLNSKNGEKEDWDAILVHLTHSTKALVGSDLMNIEAGKEVLIAVNGNLRNNHDLLAAASDPDRVYFGIFQVTGQIDTSDGKLNPMWNYEVQIHKKAMDRKASRYSRFNQPRVVRALPSGQTSGETSDGTAYDPKTGVVRSTVGAA